MIMNFLKILVDNQNLFQGTKVLTGIHLAIPGLDFPLQNKLLHKRAAWPARKKRLHLSGDRLQDFASIFVTDGISLFVTTSKPTKPLIQ
jgi:hypothetical protein